MITWNDQLAPRRRRAWALVVGPGDEILLFQGNTIPGKVAVVGRDHKMSGIWSHNIYRLELAEGVRFIPGHMGFETGTFMEGLRHATCKPTDRWHEIANALGVSLPVVREFLCSWLPGTAEKLDLVEEDLASLDETSPLGAAVVSVSYGCPTRKQREFGFWEWPVRILDEDGVEVGRISPDGEPSGDVKILKWNHMAGPGGGYVSMLLAIPEGCRAEHGPVPGEKTRAEREAEERLTADVQEWLREHGRKAVHVATQEFPFGRARIIDYADRHGCPIPDGYGLRMSDLTNFFGKARSLIEENRKNCKKR